MINFIVAHDLDRGIGQEGKIPWHFKQDFQFFKDITMGGVCIMGRHTYDDILSYMEKNGRSELLPGRECLVLTSDPSKIKHARAFDNTSHVLAYLDREVFIIGGASVYRQYKNLVDRMYVTTIRERYGCDRFFEYPDNFSKSFAIIEHTVITEKDTALEFKTYERV